MLVFYDLYLQRNRIANKETITNFPVTMIAFWVIIVLNKKGPEKLSEPLKLFI